MRFLFTGLFLLTLLFPLSANATQIQEVVSQGGIKAWLVEDHKLPLVAMHFAFRGGAEQDPSDKQGLANLTMDLLSEGAGPYDAAAFHQRRADRSIILGFSAGRDALTGRLKCLKEDHQEAFELLRLALTEPRFDSVAFERSRSQQLAALKAQLGSSDWQARYALFKTIFGSHPYGARRYGTAQTLSTITRDDVKKFASEHLAQDNLLVAVAGDMTPKELAANLDHIFGSLPKKAKLNPVAEIIWPKKTSTVLVSREGTQTELLFAMPGPKRDDKDWYAAEIANYILGGGGFASRLMQDVRESRGLTYGIDTSLSAMDHGALITGNASTDNTKTGEVWSIIQQTMRKFYEAGVTETDIKAAKDFLTGSLALAMTTTDQIAEILVAIQLENLDITYLNHRNTLINQVTKNDVNNVIKRWFNPNGLILAMVGKPEGIVPTETRELVRD